MNETVQRRISEDVGYAKPRFRDRDFVVWDGEADKDDRGRSNYVLFGNSDGWELSSPRISSEDCLSFIIDYERTSPGKIHVGFAIGFDVNMFVRDLPKAKIQQLKQLGKTYINERYLLEYLPKKWFYVYDLILKVGVKIFDIFTFFMTSAVKAWKEYLPNDPDVSIVSKGKDQRDSFQYADLESLIRPYFRTELQLYYRLVQRLRKLLAMAGIMPNGWYGPGAIAVALLKSNKVRITRDLPDEVIEAARYAYFGGRFEQYRTGRYDGPVHSADLRSAYPHALRLCPDLSNGEWVHSTGAPKTIEDFGLYKIDFDFDRQGIERSHGNYLPMPFPYRDARGAVHYPKRVRGWYWGVEVAAALQYYRLDIEECYVFQPATTYKPFGFLEEMYGRRSKWKKEKNQAQLALKLGMNSIYGKCAQRVGRDNLEKPPTWHQLEYAGFATSMCRAMIFTAMMENPLSIIAVETDGIYSTAKLNLQYGSQLGQWDYEEYDGIVYVQSGVYWLRRRKTKRQHRWVKAKTRGFGAGQVTRTDALNCLSDLSPITGRTERFAAFSGYLFRKEWLQWVVTDHLSQWGGGGKRSHASKLCPKCCGRVGEQLHYLKITFPRGGNSYPHYLPWRDAIPLEMEVVQNARLQIELRASAIDNQSTAVDDNVAMSSLL